MRASTDRPATGRNFYRGALGSRQWQSVLNADGVAQSTDSFRAIPKVTELSVTIQVDRTPNNMIMDMGLVDMSADDKGVFALGKPFGKFYAQLVGLLRGDLPRADDIDNIRSACAACP